MCSVVRVASCSETAEGGWRKGHCHRKCQLLPDDFDEDALASVPIEFAVEDLLSRPKVELALGDRNDDFPDHDLALEVGVGVVLASAVMHVL
jgi:hypothetical protein